MKSMQNQCENITIPIQNQFEINKKQIQNTKKMQNQYEINTKPTRNTKPIQHHYKLNSKPIQNQLEIIRNQYSMNATSKKNKVNT